MYNTWPFTSSLYTLYNINTIRCITFWRRGAYKMRGFSHTQIIGFCAHSTRIFVRAPNSWETSARHHYNIVRYNEEGNWPSTRTDFTHSHVLHASLLYGTTIHTGHHCGLRTPAYRLERLVSSTRRVAPRGASSPHAPTVRTTVLSRVRSTRVCARRRRIRRLT